MALYVYLINVPNEPLYHFHSITLDLIKLLERVWLCIDLLYVNVHKL